MSAIKIDAFVISNEDYEEFDKILTVFTRQYGKLNLYAPGVNKSTSKNSYSVQNFSYSNFEIFKSKRSDKYSKLKTGYLIKDYYAITKSFTNYVYCSIIMKVTEQIFEFGQKNYKFFDALVICMENMESNRDAFKNYLMLLFFLLQNSRYKFHISKCSRCRKTNNRFVRFEHSNKTLICYKCIWPEEVKQPISFIDLITTFDSLSFFEIIQKKYNPHDLIVLHNILLDYFEYDLGFYIPPSKLLKNTSATNLNQKIIDLYK